MKDKVNEKDITIECPYKGQYRRVHPAACKWHRAENDPECYSCKVIIIRSEKIVRKNESRIKFMRSGKIVRKNESNNIRSIMIVRKNTSVTWDPSDLPPGEYIPDGNGGWKRKA